MSMVEDLLVHQGREQGHARDRGSHQEVPHGLPPAEVLQRADDQEAWDTSGTYMHTMNVWLDKTSDTALSLMKRTATTPSAFTQDCRAKLMFTILYLSRLSYVQGNNDLECLTHGGDDGSRPVDDPGHRAQGTRARKLGVSGKVNRHGRRDDVVGPECVNKAIEIETEGGHGGQRNCQKTAANERLSWAELSGYVCGTLHL